MSQYLVVTQKSSRQILLKLLVINIFLNPFAFLELQVYLQHCRSDQAHKYTKTY
jgi:hypothetical protein